MDKTIKKESTFYKNKHVKFYNIYYDFKDPETDTIKEFFALANKYMKDLLFGLCASFTYGHMTAQKMIESGDVIKFDLNKKAYASNKTVGETLKQYFGL